MASWNVQPSAEAGLIVETLVGGPGHEHAYSLGEWSEDGANPVRRTSVEGQKDALGEVRTDILTLRQPARSVVLRITLCGELARRPELLRMVSLSLSNRGRGEPARPAHTNAWGIMLDVPQRSQIAYPEGRPWCSPTSVSMVLAWWSRKLNRANLDQDVPAVARSVYDPAWSGTGNWSFNVAYAGTFPGIHASAARLRDLRTVEELIAAGIPVILSVNAPSLRGESSSANGHLIVCVGFTPEGDVVANDPWARLETGQSVRRTYRRHNVERAWEHSDRLAYLIAPRELDWVLPAVWY